MSVKEENNLVAQKAEAKRLRFLRVYCHNDGLKACVIIVVEAAIRLLARFPNGIRTRLSHVNENYHRLHFRSARYVGGHDA